LRHKLDLGVGGARPKQQGLQPLRLMRIAHLGNSAPLARTALVADVVQRAGFQGADALYVRGSYVTLTIAARSTEPVSRGRLALTARRARQLLRLWQSPDPLFEH